MPERMTAIQRATLSDALAQLLAGRWRLNILHLPALKAGMDKAESDRDYVVEGLTQWMREDPVGTRELIRKATARAAE